MNPDTDIVGGNYITVTGTGVGAGTTVVAIGASTFQIKSSNASGESALGEETGINHVKLEI